MLKARNIHQWEESQLKNNCSGSGLKQADLAARSQGQVRTEERGEVSMIDSADDRRSRPGRSQEKTINVHKPVIQETIDYYFKVTQACCDASGH